MLNDTLVFSQKIAGRPPEPLLSWLMLGTESLQYPSQASKFSPMTIDAHGIFLTTSNQDILRLQKMLDEALQQTKAIAARESAHDLPEVFDLQPLTRRRVNVRIASVKAAAFQFIAEDEIASEDDNI